jgi:two-component sensor histidine kinase/ABC-type amino acid transport substrate-binding protein
MCSAVLIALLSLSCALGSAEPVIQLSPEETSWLEAHRDQLVFAPDPFYAPFEFFDGSDGRTKGLAHDYFSLVERKLGISFKRIGATSFNQILDMAKRREVSVVNAVTATPERSEYLLFTPPYIEIKNVIITRKANDEVSRLEDLAGLRVSVVKGYAVAEFLARQFPDFNYDVVDTDLRALLDVAYGISDAAVLDLATASYLTEREGIPNIHVAGDVGFPVRLAIGSRKDAPELFHILAKAVAEITPGEKEAILRKWINLENENALGTRGFFLVLAVAILCVVVVLGAAFLWTSQLKRLITARTAHLDKALAEKVALIRELYHRTKNNMQIIISMIGLRSDSIGDPLARQYLKDLETRIQTMALVQQKLYESNDLSSLDLGEYIVEVVQQLAQANSASQGRIRFSYELQPVPVLFDIAVPVGLVLNELVGNAIRHAFPGDRTGCVSIVLKTTGSGGLELGVSDDGVGIPPGVDLDKGGSVGIQLAVSMVRTQLGGTIEFQRGNGLGCLVRFNNRGYSRRV